MTDFLNRLPLSVKGALLGFLLTLAAGLLVVLASHQANSLLMRQVADHFANAWAEALAANARADLQAGDALALQTLLRNYSASPLISHAGIYDLHEHAIAEYGVRKSTDWDYPATIRVEDRPIGQVVLTVETELLENEQTVLTRLLMLVCVILGIFAYALIAAPLKQGEQWLEMAQTSISRPVQEPPRFDYKGDDALGGLLNTVQSQTVNVSYGEKWAYWRLVVLHVRWNGYDDVQHTWDADRFSQLMLENFRFAASIVHLYHGELRIHREDGISAIFRASGQESDALFNALCAGELLLRSNKSLTPSARMGLLEAEGSRWQLAASECARVSSLHDENGEGNWPLLDLESEQLKLLEQWCELEGTAICSVDETLQQQLDEQYDRISKAFLSAE